MSSPSRRSPLLLIIGIVVAVMGLVLVGGGAWLASLGGSWYYVLGGVALAACGYLLMHGRPLALWIFAALLAATLAWSLWESGLYWWGLQVRGDVLFVVGA